LVLSVLLSCRVGEIDDRRVESGLRVCSSRYLEEADVLEEPCLDVLVVEELGEDDKLLSKELVGKVDGGVHDARAVSSDRVGDVCDVDGVERFIGSARLTQQR